jgi:hypothetical protein
MNLTCEKLLLGRVSVSACARDALTRSRDDLASVLARHRAGDWGDVDAEAPFDTRPGGHFTRWADAVVGKRLVEARVGRAASVFHIVGGQAACHRIAVPGDKSRLPARAGTGEPREWIEGDSLWDAWVVAPTDRVFV